MMGAPVFVGQVLATGASPPMTKTTWTHRLEEWSHPKPASTMAVVALVLVAIALVLLALGGVALAQDPEAFDLWVLAIGLFLLAGALVGIEQVP